MRTKTSLGLGQAATSPEIPRGDGAKRLPGLSPLPQDGVTLGNSPSLYRSRTAARTPRSPTRKNIKSAQAKNEEHLHRPGPDAVQWQELLFDDVFIIFAETGQIELTRTNGLCEAANASGFGSRKATTAKKILFQGEDAGGELRSRQTAPRHGQKWSERHWLIITGRPSTGPGPRRDHRPVEGYMGRFG